MNNYTKTGFCILWSLVFYFTFIGCAENENTRSVTVQWEQDKPVAFAVPLELLSSVSKDSVKELLQVRLANSVQPVIGDYLFNDEDVIFKPIIPFTRGLKYQVYVRDNLVEEILIQSVNTSVPEIVAVYPVPDTLPENLLKFYILFSKPMQEGDVLKNIHLIKDARDTLSSVFLEMELWNNERNMLTLWLDPGRIKRELQPNQQLGPPLTKGSHYQLVIDKNWQDAEGILLKDNFIKNFVTGSRDSLSPDERSWVIDIPKAGTKDQLLIRFNEPLDHVLAERTITIIDADNKEIKGKFQLNDHGTMLNFFPEAEWGSGDHQLMVESRLEDLAGNNLDRLFDAELTQKQKPIKNLHKREFVIR